MTYKGNKAESPAHTPNLAGFKALLPVIREHYTEYLDAKFPNAVALEAYQKGAGKGRPDFIANNIALTKVIQLAYPVLKYDKNNRPIDNRDQPCIDSVDGFAKAIKSKKDQLTPEEMDIKLATKIYASLSSLENSIQELERKKALLAKGGISQADIEDTLKFDFEYIAKCEGKLNKALEKLAKNLHATDNNNPYLASLKQDRINMRQYEKLFHGFTISNIESRDLYNEPKILTGMFKKFCRQMETLKPSPVAENSPENSNKERRHT